MRALLAGAAPGDHKPNEFGDWHEVVAALQDAYRAGGTPNLRRAFETLKRKWPQLTILVASDPAEHKTHWLADELLAAEFPPVRWAVPNVVPEGLSFLAGRPKLGKSWLALQIAQAVATGGRVFNETVERGGVLYLALEDSERRLQKRMRLQGWPEHTSAVFETAWKRLDEGGLVDLQSAIESNHYRLAVIDTLSRAVGIRDQNDVSQMTAILGNLQRLAQVTTTAILMIDHHRKAGLGESDPIDDILGSTGKGAVADAVMGLYRERGQHEATLKIEGRDLEGQALALKWDTELYCWQSLGEAGEVVRSTVQQEILDALRDQGGEATIHDIAEYTGKPKSNIARELAELVAKGKVRKGPREGKRVPYTVIGSVDNHDNRDNGGNHDN